MIQDDDDDDDLRHDLLCALAVVLSTSLPRREMAQDDVHDMTCSARLLWFWHGKDGTCE